MIWRLDSDIICIHELNKSRQTSFHILESYAEIQHFSILKISLSHGNSVMLCIIHIQFDCNCLIDCFIFNVVKFQLWLMYIFPVTTVILEKMFGGRSFHNFIKIHCIEENKMKWNHKGDITILFCSIICTRVEHIYKEYVTIQNAEKISGWGL